LPYQDQSLENLARALKHERPTVRHEAAAALLRYGPKAITCLTELTGALEKLDASCRSAQVLPYLQVLRGLGTDAGTSSGVLCELLDERAKLYSGKDKHEVYGLRTHLLVTLADVGRASDGPRFIADMLANSDPASAPDFAAAAYAAGKLGAKGVAWIPFLSRALTDDFKDAIPPPAAHGSVLQPVLTTSGRIEAIRALAQIGPGAFEVIPLLEALSHTTPASDQNMPAWNEEALQALTKIRGTGR